MRLLNKVALITGAASGFGKGMAERFVKEGAKVAIIDINIEAAKSLSNELGKNTIALYCDVTKAEDIDKAVNLTIEKLGTIDIVINNAGWTHVNQPMLEVDEETFKKVYDINVFSIFHMIKSIIPIWRELSHKGNIINIGSTAGLSPRPGLTWYNSTKGCVNFMSKALAIELAPDKIRVNCIAPVAGETPLLPQFMGGDTKENREKFISSIPLGRFCNPSDIASAAVYLASDEADLVTGVVLPVDGGRTI
ncbi:MAG: SDR family oxidoreductase [Proteobacteria bacterium]|jgi:3-oxoacyl-[acyl-carrier protein] reductase|nr:SDR family oxidoreductase [Pseudomonadota bacterium]|tara:strand:- start:280 stop:1029 length:750 start_codon:yes stop_codon:yes gene_type:complete